MIEVRQVELREIEAVLMKLSEQVDRLTSVMGSLSVRMAMVDNTLRPVERAIELLAGAVAEAAVVATKVPHAEAPAPPETGTLLVTISEAATMLGVARATAYKMVRDGVLAPVVVLSQRRRRLARKTIQRCIENMSEGRTPKPRRGIRA